MEFLFGPYFPVFGPEKTLYLDTFHAVQVSLKTVRLSHFSKMIYSTGQNFKRINLVQTVLKCDDVITILKASNTRQQNIAGIHSSDC